MPRKEKEYKYHFIYKTTNIKNSKFYIGMHSTDNLDDGYLGSGKRLRNSIRCHGIDNHIKEILEYCSDRNSLRIRESEIVNLVTLEDPLCLNLSIGGLGGPSSNWGSKRSPETKLKMSKWERTEETRKKMSNSSKGTKKSVTARKRMSESKKGTTHNSETRKKMSISHKGKIFTNEHLQNLKKPKTESHKNNMRKPKTESHKESMKLARILGKYQMDYQKIAEKKKIPIIQKLLTGEITKEWNSIKDASKSLGFCYSSIIKCLKGRTKQFKGFVWEYKL